MKPKKLKALVPELASKLQLSEQEVKSVLDAYWNKVRKTLSSLEHNRISLKGLGTFYIKPWSIDKKIRVNNAVIERYVTNPTTSGLHIMNDLIKDNLKLNQVKERQASDNVIREKKKHERRNQNLEGEEQDS